MIPVGVTPTALAVGDGAVWVTSAAGAQRHEDRRRSRPRGRQDPDGCARSRHRRRRRECLGHGRVEPERRPHRCSARATSSRRWAWATGRPASPSATAPCGSRTRSTAPSRASTLARTASLATIPVGEGPDGIAVGPGRRLGQRRVLGGDCAHRPGREPGRRAHLDREPAEGARSLTRTASGSRSRPPARATGEGGWSSEQTG